RALSRDDRRQRLPRRAGGAKEAGGSLRRRSPARALAGAPREPERLRHQISNLRSKTQNLKSRIAPLSARTSLVPLLGPQWAVEKGGVAEKKFLSLRTPTE